jgi:hypothetical protein
MTSEDVPVASQLRQIIRQHVAPVIPIVAAPFSIVEPVLDALGIQNFGYAIGLVACVVPFTSAEGNAHVIVFPWIGHVRQAFVRAIEINVVVMIAVEK